MAGALVELAKLTTWQIEFSRYSHQPVVAVTPGTSLNEVEKIARQALFEELSRHGNEEHYLQEVKECYVKSVTRVVPTILCVGYTQPAKPPAQPEDPGETSE